MSIDHSAAALDAALRAFGESLGRALSEGITRGLQEGLSRSLELDGIVERVPVRAAEGLVAGISGGARRGGRPRGEVRPCRVSGCPDPARSRGLCSRHYQQELRREKSQGSGVEAPVAAPPVAARPPIVRRRAETESIEPAPTPVHAAGEGAAEPAARREEPRSPIDAAKRIFG